MFCRFCGAALPEAAATCPKCSKPTSIPPDPSRTSREVVDRVVEETSRAARDLADAAGRFTDRLAVKMKAAADDPKGTAERTARRVARDLDRARAEIEKALKDL